MPGGVCWVLWRLRFRKTRIDGSGFLFWSLRDNRVCNLEEYTTVRGNCPEDSMTFSNSDPGVRKDYGVWKYG